MLSINTNLPSLIAQNSLKTSTLRLNQAVERMSTGFKINHASDNAANYSISTNMTTKINAYEVAEDNVAMGLDMLNSANGSLDLISDKLARLRALAEQAANGSYGKQSLKAMEAEAKAIKDELVREYNTAEYNGNKIFGDSEIIAGFINEVQERDTRKMAKLSEISPTQSLTSGTYSISTAEELAQLATMTNAGRIGVDTEFVLANDIDLAQYCEENIWTPIGVSWGGVTSFRGTFDGNGHVISNLKIDSDPLSADVTCFRSLFSMISENAEIKNLGLENADIYVKGGGKNIGTLVGYSANSTVSNCYTTGQCIQNNLCGGLVSMVNGGLVEDCYSTVNVLEDPESKGYQSGGLIGYLNGTAATIRNCHAYGSVEGQLTGGFIGDCDGGSHQIIDCSSHGNVYSDSNSDPYIGSFIGRYRGNTIGLIQNCYTTGNVTSNNPLRYTGSMGGFIGHAQNINIVDSYQTGSVNNKNLYYVTQFIGSMDNTVSLKNCSALGVSEGVNSVFLDQANGGSKFSYENCKYNSCYEGKALVGPRAKGNVKSDKNNSAVNYSTDTSIQCGINSDEASQITMNTRLDPTIFNSLYNTKLNDTKYLNAVDEIISKISAKQTEFGSGQNRLESALDEISTQYENLVSSRSTLRDADISEVSSEYIRQQILQQASATLMATANQTPALALQLI